MKIRTITVMYNPSLPNAAHTLQKLVKLKEKGVKIFTDAGYEVQTTRLATPPFPYLVPSLDDPTSIEKIKSWEKTFIDYDFSYYTFGPALPEFPESYRIIPSLLEETKNAFFSAVIADARQGINLPAIRAAAEIIEKASSITADGFTNLRFTTLANVGPYGPFFPAAYLIGDQPVFSLALESADLAVNAFSQSKSVSEARTRLLDSLHEHSRKLETLCMLLENEFEVIFKGLDFSLAPFPLDECSLGGAIEKLGVQQIGLAGSLAAAAIVAETLDRGQWTKAGFNGLMLPVLEDSILAQRTIEGTLTVKDLLLYSCVCGTGLDTVPLPGDVSAEQIAALLADIATLSIRLDKPLTGRLMPVPGKKAGELTSYDFEFFKNGRILELPAQPMFGILAGNESYHLKPKHTFK